MHRAVQISTSGQPHIVTSCISACTASLHTPAHTRTAMHSHALTCTDTALQSTAQHCTVLHRPAQTSQPCKDHESGGNGDIKGSTEWMLSATKEPFLSMQSYTLLVQSKATGQNLFSYNLKHFSSTTHCHNLHLSTAQCGY